jgi:hypothetical protein
LNTELAKHEFSRESASIAGGNMIAIADQIGALPPDWHGAGTMSQVVLRAMAASAEAIGPIHYSAETGSGKTTLLFSHISEYHTVFALNVGGSISKAASSNLFRSGNVTFIEGPSQLTVPRAVFPGALDMVLIDGPHGYPFPDLEYYYFYPQIRQGGLLLVDDINIPTIGRMFDIIRAERMFELVKVVEYTAFFRRTEAPVIDPLSDSWWLQGYNRAHYEHVMARESSSSRARLISKLIPAPLKRLLPRQWKTRFLKKW